MRNDWLINTLEHSWGKSPEQKKREHEYNAEYYKKNKDKWEKYRKEQSRKAFELKSITNIPPMFDSEQNIGGVKRIDLEPYIKGVLNAHEHLDEARSKYNGAPMPAYDPRRIDYENARADLEKARAINKENAKRRSQAGQAANEAAKASERSRQAAIRNAKKSNEHSAMASTLASYLNTPIGKLENNWEVGASAISESIKKGANFIKGLFK